VIQTYTAAVVLVQTLSFFTAADVDIPLLWQDQATGETRYGDDEDKMLVLFRDTDGYPGTAPPYRGWFGTLSWSGIASVLPVFMVGSSLIGGAHVIG
jgi:hypothetical protein